jgi:hypothetical protein
LDTYHRQNKKMQGQRRRLLQGKIKRVPDSLKDQVCTKFGQNPLKDVDPRVFTRM